MGSDAGRSADLAAASDVGRQHRFSPEENVDLVVARDVRRNADLAAAPEVGRKGTHSGAQRCGKKRGFSGGQMLASNVR